MPHTPGRRKRIPSKQPEKVFRRVVSPLALAGLAVSAYLTYLQFSGSEAAFCVQGSGCDIVRASSYSHFFGVPVALVGVLGYATILGVSLAPVSSATKRFTLFLMALAGFTFSAYLTYLELAVIKAVCFYCVLSLILMTGILGVLLIHRPLAPGASTGKLALSSGLVVALVLAGVTLTPFANRSELSKENLHVALAKHLSTQGAIMYGAYWCPHCTDQKQLFGDAFSYINYVECDPRGRNPKPSLCRENNINGYPTWWIKGKFYEGFRPLEELARISGFSNSPE